MWALAPGKDARGPHLPHAHCPAVWATVAAISVETPGEVLRAARGRSVTLPCTYRTSVLERKGFIQWDKLLWSHSVRPSERVPVEAEPISVLQAPFEKR